MLLNFDNIENLMISNQKKNKGKNDRILEKKEENQINENINNFDEKKEE